MQNPSITLKHTIAGMYIGIITQIGTADPDVIILNSSLKSKLVWTREGEGYYVGTLEEGEIGGDYISVVCTGQNADAIINGGINTSNSIYLSTTNRLTNTLTDSLLFEAILEFTIYNQN